MVIEIFSGFYRQKLTTQMQCVENQRSDIIDRPPDGPLILNFRYSETSEDGHPLGNEKVAVLQRWPSYRGQFINDPYGKFTFEE